MVELGIDFLGVSMSEISYQSFDSINQRDVNCYRSFVKMVRYYRFLNILHTFTRDIVLNCCFLMCAS